jgi:hypothetical protein
MAAVHPLIEAATSTEAESHPTEQETVRRLLQGVLGLFSEAKSEQIEQTQDLPTPSSSNDTANFSSVDSSDQAVQQDDGLSPPRGAGELGWLGPSIAASSPDGKLLVAGERGTKQNPIIIRGLLAIPRTSTAKRCQWWHH